MRWVDRLERTFGQWSIPQFPLFIVAANGVIFLLSFRQPYFAYKLLLYPEAVRAGEWWRLLTFLFVPGFSDPISLVFWLYLVYMCARALENAWGEFQFCVYYLLGAAALALASLFIAGTSLSNMPLNFSLYLAFATLFPDFELMLFPIFFPVKVKYFGWMIWLVLAWKILFGSFVVRVAIGASLFNYFLFFGPDLWESAKLKIEVMKNRRRFRPPSER